MMANFFWGIWMFEMRPIEKLNIPIFMRHRLTHLLLKILDLIDRLVHQQKEYFSLLSALASLLDYFFIRFPLLLHPTKSAHIETEVAQTRGALVSGDLERDLSF